MTPPRRGDHRATTASPSRRPIANDPTLLDDCPHRYVFVVVPARGMARAPLGGTLPLLLECVETLETRGWEPVAWDFDTPQKGVLMRRRGPGRA